MDKKLVKAERKRLETLLDKSGMGPIRKEALAPVLDNLAWQRVKLDETRDALQNEAVFCDYDNGGGQSGVREDPRFKGYFNLWRGYLAGVEKVFGNLPQEIRDEATPPASTEVLAKVLEMKKAKV